LRPTILQAEGKVDRLLSMNTQEFNNFLKGSKTNWRYLLIVVISAGLVVGGILGCQCSQVAEEETEVPEVPAGWKSYENEEIGISFYYPAEWGEVTDFMDGFADAWELTEEEQKQLEKSGEYLIFSNLEAWGPHIRVTSVQKIVDNPSFPLVGVLGMILAANAELEFDIDQFPKTIEKISTIPEIEIGEELKEEILNVFMLFAEGLRAVEEETLILSESGTLIGIVAKGGEGWDVGARDFYDAILTVPYQDEKLIYVSFTFEEGKENQEELFNKMIKSIQLLGAEIEPIEDREEFEEKNLLPKRRKDAYRIATLNRISSRPFGFTYYKTHQQYPGKAGSNQWEALENALVPEDFDELISIKGLDSSRFEYWVSSDNQKYILKVTLDTHFEETLRIPTNSNCPNINNDIDGFPLGEGMVDCGIQGPDEREYCIGRGF